MKSNRKYDNITPAMIEYASTGYADRPCAVVRVPERGRVSLVLTDGQWIERATSETPDTPYAVSPDFEAAVDAAIQTNAAAIERIRAERPIHTSSLGTQMWEPCDRCGAEPAYARSSGHLCATCIGRHDHPRISGPQGEPTHSVEPDNWIGS